MFTTKYRLLAIALLLGPVACVFGQDTGNGAGKHGKHKHDADGFSMPKLPLITMLDTNDDGELSAEELKNAPESLKKLDKNNDGQLTSDELGWPPNFDGPGGPGGPDGFGGKEEEREEISLADVILKKDANGDKKVTAQELPKSMGFLIKLMDADKDGAIDRKEIEAFERKLRGGSDKADEKKSRP